MSDRIFFEGIEPSDYIGKLRNYRSLVRRLLKDVKADDNHVAIISGVVSKESKQLKATALTEDWCGDWICNLPLLNDLFLRTGISFRIFRGTEHKELKEYYEEDGTDHIPVISLWDSDGREVVRWVEAPEKIQELKKKWKERNPSLMMLYAKQREDKTAAREFAKLYRQFLEEMADWYQADGFWGETSGEISDMLRKAL